ncbi:MAG: hypothetical protein ACOYME_08255 [Prochlorotrichaceae cyanobacterium]
MQKRQKRSLMPIIKTQPILLKGIPESQLLIEDRMEKQRSPLRTDPTLKAKVM